MQTNEVRFKQDIYIEHLETIDGVKFTPREIDIIACLVSARRTSQIASILSIAPRTVTTHFRNIMLRLDCNSQEDIISFIEKSHKLSILRDYYASLLIELAFEKALKEISKRKYEIIPGCLLVYWQNQNLKNSLIRHMNSHLLQIGFSSKIREQKLNQKIEATDKEQPILILLVEKKNQKPIPVAFHDFPLVDLSEDKNYYFGVFKILKKLVLHTDFGKIVSAFYEKYASINSSSLSCTSHDFLKGKKLRKKESYFKDIIEFILKKKVWILGVCFLVMICLSTIFMELQREHKKAYILLHSSTLKQYSEPFSIRSDLVVPTESVLLHRPELIKKIDNRLRKQAGIVSLSLIGPGGSGKTTLAREYARQQNISVVWEINAETRISLINSFETLAYALISKEEDRKFLRELYEIKNQEEKETKILLFVKERLRNTAKWLLIFDNVEQFSDIKTYFPSDPTVWGNGSVILTTRDSNIQNNSYINYSIPVGELSIAEKHSLFAKIHKIESIDTQKADFFLKEIPPYPLDISTTAYYLKDTGLSYNDYLNFMHNANHDFEHNQEILIKEISEYTKTRYGIITLSLKKLIEEHPDFKELLLFISLLDSQGIPKELLASYKDNIVVDELIHSLRKHSLITSETTQTTTSPATISMHRSIRSIILAFLTQELNLRTDKKTLERLDTFFYRYLITLINTETFLASENLSQVKFLVRHVEAFINHHSSLVKNTHTYKIKGELGYLYYSLTLFEKAQALLEDVISKLKAVKHQNKRVLARIMSHLGMLYGDVGQSEKSQFLLEKSIKLYEKDPSKTDPRWPKTLAYLSILYSDKEDTDKALSTLEQSLIIYKKYFPKNDLGRALSLAHLGKVHTSLWNFEKGKTCIEESLNIYRNHGAHKHTNFGWAVTNLGYVYWGLGEFEKARNLIEESFAIYKKFYSEDSIYIAWSLRNLGRVYNDLGYYEKAQSILEQSTKIYKKALGNNNIKTQWAIFDLGRVYINRGQLKRAKIIFKECLIFCENYYRKDYILIARTLQNLGHIHLLEDDTKRAEQFMKKALTILEQKKSPEIYLSFEQLSDFYLKNSEIIYKKGEFSQSQNYKIKAKVSLNKALSIAEKYFPKKCPHLKRLYDKIKNIS